MKVIRFN